MSNKQTLSLMEIALADFLRGKMQRLRASYTLAFEAGWVAHQAATRHQGQPILIQAVAVTRQNDDGMYLEWLLEGGITEMEFPGQVLFAMPEANDLCDEDGSAEVYTRPSEQPALVAGQWPKLEKPAMVGASRFSAGVSSRLVVEAAQRHYEYEVKPEKETLRIAQGATSLLQRWRHAVLPPSAAVLCLMAVAAKNACGEDAAGIPLFVFVAAIKAALSERHSDHARALDAATSLDDGGLYVSDT